MFCVDKLRAFFLDYQQSLEETFVYKIEYIGYSYIIVSISGLQMKVFVFIAFVKCVFINEILTNN